MDKTEEIAKKAPLALDLTQTRGTKNRKLTEEEKETNRLLSKTRSRGEHIFLIAKRIFGFLKVRYKELAKNTNFTGGIAPRGCFHLLRGNGVGRWVMGAGAGWFEFLVWP